MTFHKMKSYNNITIGDKTSQMGRIVS